jgi:hydroxymethylpyrimidine/phosphomethylpyrimidine kinase
VFERFTERARMVIVLGQEESRTLGHDRIGTEHILLGLLREEDGVAARALQSLGVTLEGARADVIRLVGAGGESSAGQIPFTPRAKKVLELSFAEAQSMRHSYIGTEHLLLSLVREGDGPAARVLHDRGVDAQAIRGAVLARLERRTEGLKAGRPGADVTQPANAQPTHDGVGRGTPVALTIAGSDSGGGAGIQADLKAFASCGVHGTSAITAITAQNTREVSAVAQVAPEMVLAQVRAVVSDIGVDAVKVGMLGDLQAAQAVAAALAELPPGTPVVVDPVMVAESGARLIEPAAERVLVEQILPLATVVTPNLLEARVLAGAEERADEGPGEAEQLIRAVLELGPAAVVLTGGHRDSAVDLFLARGSREIVAIEGERHAGGSAHGSGCTHSAVLAAQLALGREPLEAARIARERAGAAVAAGLRDLGEGAGPVDVVGLARLREG